MKNTVGAISSRRTLREDQRGQNDLLNRSDPFVFPPLCSLDRIH